MIYPTIHLSHREMVSLRQQGKIKWGGHVKSKIYGTLDCPGARRWIAKGHYVGNRVFFSSEREARSLGYRPCANCMPEAYRAWKKSSL